MRAQDLRLRAGSCSVASLRELSPQAEGLLLLEVELVSTRPSAYHERREEERAGEAVTTVTLSFRAVEGTSRVVLGESEPTRVTFSLPGHGWSFRLWQEGIGRYLLLGHHPSQGVTALGHSPS